MAETSCRHDPDWRPSTRAGRPRRRRRRWLAPRLEQDQAARAKRSPECRRPPSRASQPLPPLVAAGLLIVCCALADRGAAAQSLSIQPGDFDRLIMPCYLGGGPFSAGYSARSSSSSESTFNSRPAGQTSAATYFGPSGSDQRPGASSSSSYLGSSGGGGPSSLSSSLGGAGPLNGQPRDSLTNNLGQTLPRANTVENFIALVSKIEAANPRLANNPDQLIRTLLGRFRLDNYYYDVRARTPISEPDRRTSDILPALMNAAARSSGEPFAPNFAAGGLIDQVLDQDEKCSMYFMLSHFIDKSAPTSSGMALGGMPVVQLAGPLQGQRAPSYQAAGSGYPANSASAAYSSAPASGSQRYPGPAPSFGSPLTGQMTGFGAGVSNTSPEQANQRSPYGVNSPQLTGSQYQSAVVSQQLRNPQSSFPNGPQARPPYIDVSGRYGGQQQQQQRQLQDQERLATEYGVVTISNQDNSAVVLNRVLLGILASNTPPQTIRQLAPSIYPNQDLSSTPRLDEELDPLFAVTLADLWAISSIPKAGNKQILLGDAGRWNSQMCPTSFALERSHSIRFTSAELLGGLDGLNLGVFRRRLASMRRHLRLSELLRIYYSRTGFRPQYPDVGVCQRASIINTQLDELRRQSENYLRLYQLNLPTSDHEIALQVARLDAFREFANRAASATPDICQQGDSELFVMDNSPDSCEMSRADIVAVLDTSPQANKPFMQLVTLKLAQRAGLSRQSNSLSILTNQQDSQSSGGGGGGYMFNSIVRNSTNLGEVGCALVHDQSSSYQGGQVTEATKLMEMFERALVSLDTEYLMRVRREEGQSYLSGRQSSASYISSWFGASGQQSYAAAGSYSPRGDLLAGPQTTGGAKIIVWFNYGLQSRPARPMSGPTDWIKGQTFMGGYEEQNEYRFHEAKKLLRENFRGASILALAPNREDVKAFVYDEERDILTDVAQGNGGSSLDGYQSAALSPPSSLYEQPSSEADSGAYALLSGQADQLVAKLMRRMCSIPASFQYPSCFRVPSESVPSVGFISPGRRQYWMMSPKTFFASQSVRMIFRVEGGRLRVCFGRKPNPDDSASRNGGQSGGGYQPSTSFQLGGQQQQQQQAGLTQPSSDDYYTGLDYGVCKDVGQNQEIDFLVSDPCYRKSIAECEPFYFVIRELSQPGEGDPNYMCRDDGCKRIDQAKFTMTHTGVSCNSAPGGQQASWFLIMISTLAASIFTLKQSAPSNKSQLRAIIKSPHSCICLLLLVAYLAVLQQVAEAQQGTTYDFGQGRAGEKRGNFTPSEVVAIILIVMLILGGLALTVALCYYVTKRADKGMQPVSQDEYS